MNKQVKAEASPIDRAIQEAKALSKTCVSADRKGYYVVRYSEQVAGGYDYGEAHHKYKAGEAIAIVWGGVVLAKRNPKTLRERPIQQPQHARQLGMLNLSESAALTQAYILKAVDSGLVTRPSGRWHVAGIIQDERFNKRRINRYTTRFAKRGLIDIDSDGIAGLTPSGQHWMNNLITALASAQAIRQIEITPAPVTPKQKQRRLERSVAQLVLKPKTAKRVVDGLAKAA